MPTHALLIAVPAGIQPEQFRYHLEEAAKVYGRAPDGLLAREQALMEQSIKDAKVVQLPEAHSGPYATVGPLPAP